MTRAERLRTRRARRSRIVALVSIIGLACATGGTIAMAAVAQVTEMTVCVAADGSTSQFNPYEGDCPGSTQEVAWSVHGVAPTTTTTSPSPTTIAPTTTTKPPVTTTTQPGPVGNNKPAAGGYFRLSAPGTPFPTETSCAVAVHRSTWEPRPDNAVANARQVTNTLANSDSLNAAWNATYKPRIDGSFHGTTDEMFQFYACKWGLADEWLRAEAISESNWHQSQVGDAGTSYGILQIRYLYHPRVACKSCAGSSWPNTELSTAWNMDQFGAEIRGCYEGMEPYLGTTRGQMPGCIQRWFSGSWTPGGGAYYQGVLAHFTAKPWLNAGF